MRIGCPTEQSQVNLAHPPGATDPRQAQNKIIISGIDLCEGLNWLLTPCLITQLPNKPQATVSPLPEPFFLSTPLNHI